MSISKKSIFIGGLSLGFVAILLAFFGNPANMAICVACFIRDTAGAMKLHSAAPVQYVRPEIAGIVLGAASISFIRKERNSVAGSSPAIRFILGIVMMIGALVFLGCPLRLVLRMAGGDLNAYVGLIGFAAGIFTGTIALKKGFSLGKSHPTNQSSSVVLPLFLLGILFLSVTTSLFVTSSEGPGSMHAPLLIALAGGIIFGITAQILRLCFSGSLRDVLLIKNYNKLTIIGIFFSIVLIYNLVSGNFNLGFTNQPIAHTEHLWNILGMYVVGLAGVLLSGCPLRQLVLAGQGSSDASIVVFGMFFGGAIAHNFNLASSGEGTTAAGRIATIICILILLIIATTNRKKGFK